MAQHLPLTHAHMEKLNGQWTNTIQQRTGTDTGTKKATDTSLEDSGQGNNRGGSDQAGVRGTEGRPVRNESADAGRVSVAERRDEEWAARKLK